MLVNRLLKIILGFILLCALTVLQGCIAQKFVNEGRWEKYIEDKDVAYTFIEVGPHNIKEVLIDQYETFNSKCLNKPQKDYLTHPVDTEDYQYKLGVGDEIFIKISAISGDPEFFARTGRDLIHIFPEREVAGPQVSYQVDAQGFLSLPYVGQFYAIGMTTHEVQDRLAEQSRRYYKNTYVEVKMAKHAGFFVDVVGGVKRARRIPMDSQPMTVVRALALANGPDPRSADLKEAFIRRGTGEKIPVDLVSLLYGGNNDYNYLLEHNDMLVVPVTREDRIFVTGELTIPQMVETNFMDFMLIDALLGSRTDSRRFNDRSFVYVLRGAGLLGYENHIKNEHCQDLIKDSPPHLYVYKFDLRMPQMKIIANSFPLYDRDIVYIGSSTLQNWDRLIDMLLQGSVFDHYDRYLPNPDYNNPNAGPY
ncbi:MAG: hypothetical protein CMK59_13950 [Proteobacteria bacterium]|nr:hypothetical protein [Pseudomonadota bacterium]